MSIEHRSSSASGTARVVLVDDDVVTLKAMEQLVTAWGYTTVAFADFEAARSFLHHESADGMIVDIRLGEYNGLQLIHLARQAHPTMVLLTMSGFDDPVLRLEATRAGAYYFVKPLDAEAVHALLHSAMNNAPSHSA